jgi:hypothetical protein
MFDKDGEEPNTPYKELLAMLKDYGFEGSVVGEYEGWLMNYEPSEQPAQTLLKLLQKYGRQA